MYYELGGPKFSLQTGEIEIVESMLSDYLCTSCFSKLMEDNCGLRDISVYDMLDTSCGAEFMFKEYDSYEDYWMDICFLEG